MTVACPTCGVSFVVPNAMAPKSKAKKAKKEWSQKTRQKRLIHWVERAARLCGHGGGRLFSDVEDGLRKYSGEADASEHAFIEGTACYFQRRREAALYAELSSRHEAVPNPDLSVRLWTLADTLRTRFGISEGELARVWKDQ